MVHIHIPPSTTVDAEDLRTLMARAARDARSAEPSADEFMLAVTVLDLTTLNSTDTPETVAALCRRAIRPMPRDEELIGRRVPPVGAVCVYSSLVAGAREVLGDSPVRLAAVGAEFPSGQVPLVVKVRGAEHAIADGADEIDMVINRGQVLVGRLDRMCEEVFEVARLCRNAGAHLKVILETAELGSPDGIRRASDAAIAAMSEAGALAEPGGGFLKTSTGTAKSGATPEAAAVMLQAIRDHHARTGELVGIKPAGGIRTADEARLYMRLAETIAPTRALDEPARVSPVLFRIGASSLLDDLLTRISSPARPAPNG